MSPQRGSSSAAARGTCERAPPVRRSSDLFEPFRRRPIATRSPRSPRLMLIDSSSLCAARRAREAIGARQRDVAARRKMPLRGGAGWRTRALQAHERRAADAQHARHKRAPRDARLRGMRTRVRRCSRARASAAVVFAQHVIVVDVDIFRVQIFFLS